MIATKRLSLRPQPAPWLVAYACVALMVVGCGEPIQQAADPIPAVSDPAVSDPAVSDPAVSAPAVSAPAAKGSSSADEPTETSDAIQKATDTDSEDLATSVPKDDVDEVAGDSAAEKPSDNNEKPKSLLSPIEDDSDEDPDTNVKPTDAASEPEPPTPEETARKAFGPPPGAKMLLKNRGLWVDRDLHRVYIDGYIATNRGPLEMFACPFGTKEHESIVAALPKSSEVHASLLAINATPGTPVRFRPEFLPPTGQVIRVFAMWRDKDKKFHVCDARQWVKNIETEKPMDAEFVFAGSSYWQDPVDGQEFYRADSGDMICVSNFSSAMIDVSINSSDDAESLLFVPVTDKIPERYTPVRLVLIPVPQPTDAPRDEEAEKKLLAPPVDDYLPLVKQQ